jgi:hypothetical protein
MDRDLEGVCGSTRVQIHRVIPKLISRSSNKPLGPELHGGFLKGKSKRYPGVLGSSVTRFLFHLILSFLELT